MPICLSDCYPRRSRSTKHTVRPHADNGPPVARNHPRVIGAGGLGEFELTRRALFFSRALQPVCPKIPLSMLGLRRSAENHLVWIALIGRLLREISERGWRRSLQCSVE